MKKLKLIIIMLIIISGCRAKTSNEKSNTFTSTLKETKIEQTEIEKINLYNYFLIKKNEEILFSFFIANENKVVTLAKSKNEPSYMIYRFGNKDNIEVEFPKNLINSWDEFTYSYYFRGGNLENEGLDLNYVTFEENGIKYKVFQEYSSKKNEIDIGIEEINMKTNKSIIYRANENTIIGNLNEFRNNKKINIDVE